MRRYTPFFSKQIIQRLPIQVQLQLLEPLYVTPTFSLLYHPLPVKKQVVGVFPRFLTDRAVEARQSPRMLPEVFSPVLIFWRKAGHRRRLDADAAIVVNLEGSLEIQQMLKGCVPVTPVVIFQTPRVVLARIYHMRPEDPQLDFAPASEMRARHFALCGIFERTFFRHCADAWEVG